MIRRFYRDIRYHGSWHGGKQLNTAEGKRCREQVEYLEAFLLTLVII
ncbi:MAG: hypothetical protein ACLRS8_13110 [Parabacteroides merdae]